MSINLGFCPGSHEVTTPHDLAQSTGMCGDTLAFLVEGCSDWIPTVPWPWTVLALSTKQYMQTYHETRHKSLSLRWSLNQVVVSGWGRKGLLRTRGAKRKHPVHHIIAYVKKTTRLGNVKGVLNVFIRLFLQRWAGNSRCNACCMYLASGVWISLTLTHGMTLIFTSSI